MTSLSPTIGVGRLLREWRSRRRLGQLDLAREADVSPRHLSFVETGRSRPSRELLLHLAEHLEVPLRDRNALLVAAGYAPAYRNTSLDAAEMVPLRDAVDKILAGHEPYPALVLDRQCDLVAMNRPAFSIVTEGVAAELLTPPVNVLRLVLHPDGLGSRIVNLPEYSAHVLARLHRQTVASADPDLVALHDELRRYPGVQDEPSVPPEPSSMLFVPLALQVAEGVVLTFFSTTTTFGPALDITVEELAIESFFPADDVTAKALRAVVFDPQEG